jgi:hypothetical protein
MGNSTLRRITENSGLEGVEHVQIDLQHNSCINLFSVKRDEYKGRRRLGRRSL